MLNVINGKIKSAIKTVIYGAEGIGKSTLASKFPDPVFIDTEGGTARLDVKRILCSESWEELLRIINEINETPNFCKTLVLDTADWAEALCVKYTLKKLNVAHLEDMGYGKSYVYVGENFKQLLSLLDKTVSLGINVTIIAHGKPRKYELPEEAGSFDRWEMKLTRQVAPLLKEWCDMLLFCNYKTIVVTTETKTKKAEGGKRVMYTSHHPTFDAKNRFELNDELDLDFNSIAHLFSDVDVKNPNKKHQDLLQIVTELSKDKGVSIEEIEQVVVSKGHATAKEHLNDYKDEFIEKWVISHFDKIVEVILANRNKGGK